jgi:Tol biopolymer transport system component
MSEVAGSLPAEDRALFLAGADLDDETRAEVLALHVDLQAAPDPESLFEVPSTQESFTWAHVGKRMERFRIIRPLGRGGMGEVYRASDPDLNRDVAIKFLSRLGPGSSGAMERFVREAQAASSLNHPGIVTVYEAVRADGFLAIVMELVEGEALRARCGSPQPIQLVAEWGRQIAHALVAAHASGIIHRDIKPENLMLRPDGYIKVLDFGLARRTGATSNSSFGLLSGTLRYMSPEQTRAGEVTPRADIFSLGLVLYELATGVHPFQHESVFETVHLILTADAALPSSRVHRLPVEFDALILAMIHKDPALRPDAEKVARRLGALGDSGALSLSRRRSRPARGWLVTVGILLLIAGATVASLSMRRNFSGKPDMADAPDLRAAPFTSLPGDEADPAFSPDGRQIAYAWDGGEGTGNRDIYVKLAGPGDPLRLTSNPDNECNPTWSPDASQIAFLRYTSSGVDVVVIGARGGAEHVVGQIANGSANNRNLITWSPDPGKLVVADSSLKSTRLRLFSMQIGSGEKRALTGPPDDASDMAPAFSPDGRHLAFLRYRGGATFTLFVTSAGGGAERLLATTLGPIQGLAWAADSHSILYSWGMTEPDRIWCARLSGGPPAPAAFSLGGAARDLTIAPVGQRIAFVQENLDSNIWAMTLGRDRAFHKLISSTREDEDPQFSMDGARIAFTSRRSGKFELWVCQRDGSSPRAITAQGAFAGSSSWSPDGRTIAYDSLVSGRSEVWLVNAEGGTPRRLLQPPVESMLPKWSSDGAWVYFFRKADGGEIWKAPAGGGTPQRVTGHGGFEGMETPDGKSLYFVKSSGAPGLWRLPRDGGKEERVPGVPALANSRMWTIAQGGIFFAIEKPSPALEFYDLRTGRLRTVIALPSAPMQTGRGLSVSPDGQMILYTRTDTTRREIMVADGFR